MESSPRAAVNFQELDELILKILSGYAFGLSPAKIRKDLPLKYRCSNEQLRERLEKLAAQGDLHRRTPPAGKTAKPAAPIFSVKPLETSVRTQVLTLLSSQNLTPAQIKKIFPPHIARFLPQFLDSLIQQGQVKWHPPRRGKRLSRREPDPGEFLGKEIKKVFEKGKILGFSEKAILEAIRPYGRGEEAPASSSSEMDAIIFRKMKELEPASVHGALVYIPRLRKNLNDLLPDKEAFDRAILSLADRGKVQLQAHSRVSELTEEEQNNMINDGQDGYYMAIGIRME
jgi:hypothetical protein